MIKKIFAAVLGLSLFLCSICAAYAPPESMYVTMLNVGQGDAFLVETPTQNILIDTGDVTAREQLIAELKKAGVTRIEKIILTHAHSDHIGGVMAVLKNFPVDQIIDNGFYSTNPLYKKYHAANVKFSSLRAGNVLDLGGGVYFEVLWPNSKVDYTNINNQSIVGRVVYEDCSVLFTGDAERAVEKELLENDLQDIQATVLKAGHHGSRSSNSSKFVKTVKPQYILISAALGNPYGHPHRQPLKNFLKVVPSENIFCTAFNGTVRLEFESGDECEACPEINIDWVDAYLEE